MDVVESDVYASVYAVRTDGRQRVRRHQPSGLYAQVLNCWLMTVWLSWAMTLPDDLRQTFRRWFAAGRPPQAASRWVPDAWRRQFPEHAEFLDSLGIDRLDRAGAIERAPVVDDEASAVQVFLLAMLWGYGPVGYGPFRTRRILDRPEATSELLAVARQAQHHGGLAAFKLVAQRRSDGAPFLKWLGPAFGTKYIYFLTANDSAPAPVMDAVVNRWFTAHAPDRPLIVDSWHAPSYETYLASLKEWSEALHQEFGHDIRCDDIEYLIFASGSRFEGNQWSESWDAELREASPTLLFDQLRALASSRPDRAPEAEQAIDKLEELLGPVDTHDHITSN